MKKEKIRFFSRMKLAITKLEDYNVFINEKLSIGIKYFLLISLLFAILLTIIETFDFYKKMAKGYEYINDYLPNFVYSNGNLDFSENIDIYDSEFEFRLIAETEKDASDENINEYKGKIESQGLILFKDKAVFVNNGSHMVLDYLELQESYQISELNKEILIEKINSIGIVAITIMYFAIILLGIFIFEFISLFMDCIVLSIFSYCAVKITKTNLNYRQAFNISIYALTLPIILYMIYCIANYVFDFYTQYFKTIYLLIAYVYVVAVILIIKSDMMKQKVVIGKIEEIKKEDLVEEKKEENKDEEEDENTKDDKKTNDKNKDEDEDVLDGEPDGSEI